jgi:DNA-binding response OmpR family regulator
LISIEYTSLTAAGLLTLKETIQDLVLLNITFPDLDGFQFLQELRGAPETEAVPIIILIEKSQEDKKGKYVYAGATICLVKPVLPHRLLAQIEALHL